jgi:hypothetical protein
VFVFGIDIEYRLQMPQAAEDVGARRDWSHSGRLYLEARPKLTPRRVEIISEDAVRIGSPTLYDLVDAAEGVCREAQRPRRDYSQAQ